MRICFGDFLRERAGSFSFFAIVACASPLQAQQNPLSQKSQAASPAVKTAPDDIAQLLSTLKQPVELSCREEPLKDVLASLQKQSGVTLKVSPAWIGGMPVTAYTRKMPLGNMLRRLASLYDLSWRQEAPLPASASPSVPPANSSVPTASYVLYESAANQRDITRLKRLSWEPLRLRVARIREYAGFTPEQLAQKAKEGDKQAQALLDPNTRAKVALLANVDETMLEALIDKEAKTFSYAQLSPRSQEALRFLVGQENDRILESRRQSASQDISQPPISSESPENYSVSYTVFGDGASANLHYSLLKGNIRVSMDSAMGGGIGGDGKVWWREWYSKGQRTVSPAMSAEVRKVPNDAYFDMNEWPDALRLMHDKWQVNVFSDAYPEVSAADKLSQALPETEKAGESLADGLTRSSLWNRTWWQEGEKGTDILFLRFDWYNWRDEGEWYALKLRLDQMKARKEVPTLEDLALVATLSQARLQSLRITAPMNGRWQDSSRDMLKFYAGLSNAEKLRLGSSGLKPSSLSLLSQRRLLKAIQSLNAHASEDWLPGVLLYLNTANGASELHFKTSDADNPLAVCRWTVQGIPAILTTSVGGQFNDAGK